MSNSGEKRIGRLSEEERAVIREMRVERSRQEAQKKFHDKALQIAYRFQRWSNRTGNGTEYSTFVNCFGYDERGNRGMYEIVMRILNAAWPLDSEV